LFESRFWSLQLYKACGPIPKSAMPLGTDMSKHADVLEKMQSVTTVVADLPDNGEEYFREPPNRYFRQWRKCGRLFRI